ncbi:MAG: hypothetical protein MUC63_06705, partial [Planctomycetes bacterium]|nr:hypothetical protein [Planctomycetota bacterium]
MSKRIGAAAFLAAAVLAGGAARGADDPAALAALLEAKAPSVVSVKAVIKMEINFMGQSQTEESTQEFSAVVVDPSGLIMSSSVPLSGPAGMMPRIRGAEIDMKTTPISLKVIFPGDEKEYDAVLGATDSNLNLSFLKIKKL